MDVAYKQKLCSVEIYSSKPCFRSPLRKSATKFKVVTEMFFFFYGERLKISDVFLYLFFALLHSNSFWSNPCANRFLSRWSNGSIQGLHCCSQKTDEYLEAFYLPICAQALSCVCFTHCKPLSACSDWQAYNLDCILMLLPYAAKRSGDSWGTVRRSGEKRWHWILCTCVGRWQLHTDTRWRQLSEFNCE